MDSYYVQKDSQQFGPLTRESLQQYFDAGVFSADDWAVQEGGAEWVPLGNFVQAEAVLPEQFRGRSELEVQFDESPALASSDVPAGRKRLALAVLIVGLLGGGTALAFYFMPSSPQGTPHSLNQPVEKNPESQPKPKSPAIKPPPQVPLPLVVEGPEKLTQTKNAARKGIPLDCLHMSFRLLDGWGLPQNRARAVADAERASSGQSNVTAKLFLSSLYLSGRAPEKLALVLKLESESLDQVIKLADAGNVDAQLVVGLRVLPRRNYPGDLTEAVRQLGAAANQNHPIAQHRLGQLHLQGRGVKKNPAMAARWFAAAARQGHSEALRYLGVMYLQGNGVRRNPAEAVRLTDTSALLGNIQARYGMARMLDQGVVVPKNKIDACKWFLLIAPKNPAAKKHVVRMHEELEPSQFTEAVVLARKIDPNLFVPSFVPVPPAVAKPSVAELGTIELPAVDALAAIIDGLAKGRAETLWEALPKPYQAEAMQLALLAGTNLNRELHRAAFGTLSRISVMLKGKKGLLLPVLKSDKIFPADDPEVGLQALRTFISAVITSELSDPKWLDSPDLAKLTENTGGKLLSEWDLLSSALPNQGFTWAMLKDAKCELVESNDHNATVKFTIGENELQLGLQQVEGKWLPEKLVRVWPQAVISIRTFLKTPAEAASDPQLRLIELLSSINKELENLEQAESNEAFATAWAGLLAVLLPEKESAVQPPAPDVTPSVPPEIEQPEPQP